MSVALAGFLIGTALSAAPAMALTLNPEAGSPGVDKANTFHWIIFIVLLVAIVVVNLAILRASRHRHRHDPDSGKPARKGTQLKVGLGLGVIALAIFVTATVFSDQSRQVPVSTETVSGMTAEKQLEIEATGQQWLWRFNYPNGAFSYRRLVVPAGVTVALKLVSTDVIHGWNVPSLTGKADAVPGKTNWVYFRADEIGIHEGRSAIMSGQGYATMQIEVDVVSPEDYEAYVKELGTDIQDAQNTVEKRNKAAAEATAKVDKEAATTTDDTVKSAGGVDSTEGTDSK
jgi:cytochrome c oxidase subunit 2